MKKVFKVIGILLGSVIVLIFVAGYLFLKLSPQFGGSVTEEQKLVYEKTGHYKNGKFENTEQFSLNLDCHSVTEMLKKMLKSNPKIAPKRDIEVVRLSAEDVAKKLSAPAKITWLGHSSFLIEIDGKVILIDPVFSKYAAPHALLGKARYNSKMPIYVEDLPLIDIVLISHDHYDHLDYETIKKLKAKTKHYLVPLGVGNHLRSWGVDSNEIYELDWWQEKQISEMTFVFTPAKHMSGRGLSDQKATLWGSWVIKGSSERIYFNGDSGYGSHFKQIGEKYGPFDIGLMECGQYDVLWPDVHMMPEQTVQAAQDLKAKLILPIHWGAFTLANHNWTDPIERITAEAKKRNFPIATPRIGETLKLGAGDFPKSRWWEEYQ